jgi:hypothetical protein
MMVGSASGNSAVFSKAGLPLMLFFAVTWMFFQNTTLAQEAPESDQAETQVTAPVDEAARLEEIEKTNNKCLICHKRDRTKSLENGEELSLQVHKEDYLASAHAQIECTACHQAIGSRKHHSKSTNITIHSRREYELDMNASCRSCHASKYDQYEGSVHYAMVIQGSEKAPLCSGCHGAHAIKSVAELEAETGYPCKNCHEPIYNAYTASVHGQARILGNTIRDSSVQSPACYDCHHSHDVTALAIGDVLRESCIDCHGDVTLIHSQWLPNAGTHLDIVSCAVCHAPFARRKFDLHLYDNVAQVPVGQGEGDAELTEQIQEALSSDDPLELWRAQGGFSQPGRPMDISLRSRMEVMSGVAAHQIANKSFAVRTCDSCHEQSTRQSQNVTVSITQPDGRRQSFETDRQILRSVPEINSISQFYELGGNPNKILDYMLILSLLAGFAIPIGHFMMGKMIRNAKPGGEQ